MIARIQHRMFPSFAGVALADILANGVAIIIMLIVITIMIKHQQEEKRLEQVEDVSVLLSRDIATSVVMNALPTSPPARLHHYHSSPLDRNPTHAVMPIIELHRDHVRNYYTGETISRDALLHRDNAFDRYVGSLDPRQLLRMRVDVYSIRLFYIVMSILKSHQHRPNHWHFIGYAGDGSGTTTASGRQWTSEQGNKPNAAGVESAEGRTGEGDPDGLQRVDNQAGRNIPQSAKLNTQPGGLENYPYDDLAFDSDQSQTQAAPADLPGDVKQPAGERAQLSDQMFKALAELMGQDAGDQASSKPRLSRFRSARAGLSQSNSPPKENGGQPLVQIESYRLLLPALFAFMEEVQTEADAGGATRLAEYDFHRDVLQQILDKQQPRSSPEMNALFDRLGTLLDALPPETDTQLPVEQQHNEQLRANALAVPVNRRLPGAALAGNTLQDAHPDLPGAADVSLHFGLYPTIFRGLRAPLKKDALILMPPQQQHPEKFRWRVVTLVSPAVDDFMTAFVYSAFDGDGRLLLAAEENALNIAQLRVTTNYPTLPFRNERWLLLLYGIPALLIACGVLRKARMTA